MIFHVTRLDYGVQGSIGCLRWHISVVDVSRVFEREQHKSTERHVLIQGTLQEPLCTKLANR